MDMYTLTVPQFVRTLTQAKTWLDKAQAHATTKKFDVENFVQARLAPDQYPLVRQIQAMSDQSKFCAARLTGATPPAFEDNEKTFDELRARLDKTLNYLATVKPEAFADSATRTVQLPWAKGKGIKGFDFATAIALPNFYFHATTAYAILRHNGVDLGKVDFVGMPPFFDV